MSLYDEDRKKKTRKKTCSNPRKMRTKPLLEERGQTNHQRDSNEKGHQLIRLRVEVRWTSRDIPTRDQEKRK